MMLSLLLLRIARLQSHAPVHVDPIVGTMRVLCPILSAKLNIKLETSTATKEEVVGLSIDSALPEVILDHIAKTLNATWEHHGDTYTLVRTREQENEDAKRTFENLKAMYAKDVAKLRQDLATDGAFDAKLAETLANKVKVSRTNRTTNNQWYRQAKDYDHFSPGSRFVNRVLSLFGAADLAAVGTRRRVVYSTEPTKMQLRLTGPIEAIVTDYQREQTLYAEVMNRVNPPSESADQSFYPGLQSEDARKPPGRIARINVALTYPRFGEGLTATVFVINEKGQYLLNAAHAFHENQFEILTGGLKAENDDVDLEPKSVAFTDLIKTFGAGAPKPLPQNLADYLADPAAHEPLGLVIPETLGALGKQRNANVVMRGVDMLLVYSLRPGSKPGKGSIKQFLSCLTPANLALKESDGWIRIEQELPSRQRLEQMNRVAMSETVKATTKEGRLSLDTLSRFVSKSYPESVSGLSATFLAMASPNMTGFEILNRPEFLRFYATLSDAQKGLLKRGAKVPATDFSPDQQVVLGDMIFGPSANFTTEFPAPTAQAGDTTSVDPYNSSANEPTDVLPNGLTPAVTVSAMVEDRETWFSFSKNARFGQAPRPTDANGIAYDDVMRERADLFPQAAQMPVYDLFRQGRQAFWEFEIHISKMLSLNAQLSDNRVLPGEPMTRKQLPAEFLKEIATHAAEIRESFKNMTPEQFGNGKRIKPPL